MGAPVGIANASISLVLLVSNRILRTFLKTRKKRKKPRKIVLLVRFKLNIIEKITSKTLTDADISHKDFTLISNEAENYCKLNQNI